MIIALVIVLAVAYSYKKYAVGVRRYEFNGRKNPLVKTYSKLITVGYPKVDVSVELIMGLMEY